MIRQEVIDKTTKVVKRHGFCDFANDGQFDPDTEQIIEKDFDFDPDIDDVTWTWNATTETFDQEGA